jgi:hypothetical protein
MERLECALELSFWSITGSRDGDPEFIEIFGLASCEETPAGPEEAKTWDLEGDDADDSGGIACDPMPPLELENGLATELRRLLVVVIVPCVSPCTSMSAPIGSSRPLEASPSLDAADCGLPSLEAAFPF